MNLFTFALQNLSKTKESSDEKVQDLGAFSPCDPVQNLSLIQDVTSEKVMG
jgi:hypothetical protein